MKHNLAPMMVILLYGAVIARAQVSNVVPPPSFDDDFARVLTGEAIWKDQLLPGQWNEVSKQPAGAMKESSQVETTFGFT